MDQPHPSPEPNLIRQIWGKLKNKMDSKVVDSLLFVWSYRSRARTLVLRLLRFAAATAAKNVDKPNIPVNLYFQISQGF